MSELFDKLRKEIKRNIWSVIDYDGDRFTTSDRKAINKAIDTAEQQYKAEIELFKNMYAKVSKEKVETDAENEQLKAVLEQAREALEFVRDEADLIPINCHYYVTHNNTCSPFPSCPKICPLYKEE